MDRLGPHRAPPAHRRGVPQRAATVGIYVVLEHRDLRGAEVADLVESTGASFSRPLALRGLPFGLAGNGCNAFSGLTPACQSTSHAGLVFGARQDRHWRGPHLDCSATKFRRKYLFSTAGWVC